ncbi:restriction endonuclease subunit S [Candidatus Parcubacteria bacterium]|nr:restriction endonuclease subunit S [Candidatus Parcubacteria bacterium]
MNKNKTQKNIPNDWQSSLFKNCHVAVIDGDRGKNYPKQNDFSSDGFCLFLNAGNVSKSGFNFNETQFISKDKNGLMGKGQLGRGDLVITTRGTIGNIVHYDNKINFDNIRINSGMAIIRNKNKSIETKFLLYYLKLPSFRKEIKRVSFGSAQPQLTIQIINKFKFIFPPLPEQKAIVAILETWDKYLKKLSKKIEIKKNIKKGLMQRLLSGEVRLDGFSGEWKKKKLGDISSIMTGNSNREDSNLDGKYTFFDRSEDIRSSSVYLFDGEAVIVAGEGQKFVPKYFIGKFDLHQRTYAIMNFNNTDGKFIYYYLYQNKNYLLSQAVGSTVKSLRLPMFVKMPIKTPPLKEQTAIAKILTTADREIETLEKRKKIIEGQKKFLLNNLVTGKIRT